MERWQGVALDNFNGPLDLLLHMIKDKKVDIMDVNLLEISNQYIDYINSFEELDVEIASEYLIMAVYLVELKSKMLIPKEEVEVEDTYEEQRDELLRRLVEYHKIKEVSGFFKEQQAEFLKTFSKPKSVVKIVRIDDDKLPLAPNTVDMDKFAKVFLRVIEKNKLMTPQINTITSTEVSPEELAKTISVMLAESDKKIWTLEQLIEEQEYSIQMLVASFLAILDLTKQNIVKIYQKEEEILIEYIPEQERWNGEDEHEQKD